LLVIQPLDDPLHWNKINENIDISKFIKNENVLFYAPHYGNHFGFYEGKLLEAFSNKTSYTYPAKIGLAFFRTVVQHESQERTNMLWRTGALVQGEVNVTLRSSSDQDISDWFQDSEIDYESCQQQPSCPPLRC